MFKYLTDIGAGYLVSFFHLKAGQVLTPILTLFFHNTVMVVLRKSIEEALKEFISSIIWKNLYLKQEMKLV